MDRGYLVCPNEHFVSMKDDFLGGEVKVAFECGRDVIATRTFHRSDIATDQYLIERWRGSIATDHRIGWLEHKIEELHNRIKELEDENVVIFA